MAINFTVTPLSLSAWYIAQELVMGTRGSPVSWRINVGVVMAVVRQNFSRGPKRGGSGGVGVNPIIDSVQQEDPKRASPERAYICAYMKDRPKVDPNYAARL